MRVLTEGYPLPPHVCYYCRTDRLPCVDLMRDDENVHHRIEHIYLCHECIMHPARIIAPHVGQRVVATDEYDDLVDRIDALQSRVAAEKMVADAALAARDAIVTSLATNRQVEVEVTPEVVDALAYAPDSPPVVEGEGGRRKPGWIRALTGEGA